MQLLVVTHKSEVYERMESLVGVAFDPKVESSLAFSLDLRE